jgi:hypothetical protein
MSEPLIVCRWCSICEGMAHHWCEEPLMPRVYYCLHCPVIGYRCDACNDGEGADLTCSLCGGEGVVGCCAFCSAWEGDGLSLKSLGCGHAFCDTCIRTEAGCPFCGTPRGGTP